MLFSHLWKMLIIGVLILLFPSIAHGQDKEAERKIIYRERTEIDFEVVDVNGQLVKPQGTLILTRKRATFNPLIKLREDWKEEMKQSIKEVQ